MLQWLRQLFRGKRPADAHPARVSSPDRTAAPRPAAQGSAVHAMPPPAGKAAPPAAPVADPPAPVGPVTPVVPADLPSVDPRVETAVAALTCHFATNPPRLGAFPGTAARILQLFREADPDFNRVVHELQQDAAVVTKLLNVANSAFFGGTSDVDDVRGAVLRIGMRDVAQIALGVAGQSLFEPSSRSAFALLPAKWNELFHTSMAAAFTASWLSQVARVGRSDHAFLSGLIHDIGQPTGLRALAQLVIEGSLDRDVLEVADQVIDRVHVELGKSVTSLGGLPDYLCAAASLHHDAETPVGPEYAELHLVRVVDGIAAQRRGALTPEQKAVMDWSAAALALDPRWLRVAVSEYETLAAQVTRMFGIADPFAAAGRAQAAAR